MLNKMLKEPERLILRDHVEEFP